MIFWTDPEAALKSVKITQMLHCEDTENIIAAPRLLDNLDKDQQM
jgi:hypothetical protein